MTQIASTNTVFAALRARVIGQVLEPTDAGFVNAVQGWSLGHRHHPAVVVVAQDTMDVIETVCFARSNQLKIAVQATGHGFVRDAEGAVLLNVSKMNAVRVDPIAQTATIQPGAIWAQVLEAARMHGLTGLVGDTPSVGATGYVLGGGTGWFARLHGLGIDSLLEAEIVTADGELHTVNAEREPELFWALRGGGGGFGVVTSIKLRLYPHATVTAGQVIFPLEHAKDAFHAYREWIKTVPNEITSRVMLMRGPDAEFMPPFVRGRVALMLQFVYAGSRQAAQNVIAPLLGTPGALLRLVDEIAPAELGRFFGAPPAPTEAVGRAELLDELNDQAIDTLVGLAALEVAPFYLLELRHLGGAIASTPDDASAFGHRHAGFLANFRVLITGPNAHGTATQYVQAFTDRVKPFATGSILPNFIDGDEGLERDRAAYPDLKTMRVSLLKARFDPDNLFAFARTPGSRPDYYSRS